MAVKALGQAALACLHPDFRRRPVSVLTRVAFWENVRHGASRPLGLGPYRICARPHDGFGHLSATSARVQTNFSFFNHYLKPGMYVVDVGANIGTHTVYAAGLVGVSAGSTPSSPSPTLVRCSRPTSP